MTNSSPVPKKRRYLASKTVTKTSAFLLPATKLSYGFLKNYGFINAYLGDTTLPYNPEHLDCLFLKFKHSDCDKFNVISDYIREKDLYVDEYDPDKEHVIFILKLPEEYKHLKQVFLEGRYSDFDKEYIEENFKPYYLNGFNEYGMQQLKESMNYMILTRSDTLKKEIEEDLDITLKDSIIEGRLVKYQLLSKPSIEQEYIH